MRNGVWAEMQELMGNRRRSISAGSSAEEQQQLVTRDEAEEVDAEVGEDVAHLPVGVHGGGLMTSAGDPRQQERSGSASSSCSSSPPEEHTHTHTHPHTLSPQRSSQKHTHESPVQQDFTRLLF